MFRRGPDVIPRGTFALLYRSLMNDDDEMTDELLAKKLRGDVRSPRHHRLATVATVAARIDVQ
jgi:hypothetical protein